MISLFAGLRSQITLLKEKLKKHNPSKNPKVYKEILDALEAAEKRYVAEKTKREEKQKAKENAAQEVEKEAINVPNAADVGAVSQNAPAPADANGAPAATPSTTPNQNQSCPLCGGLTFPDAAAYQQHMQYTHASDIMPTGPGQKEDKLVASVEPGSCPRCGTNKNPGTEFCDECKKQVKEAEPPMVHPVVKPVDEGPKFKLDDVVKPIRGGDSKGKVMRWDGKDNDHVYVMWESGPLKDRDGFGGYYKDDLEAVQEEPVKAAIEPEPACEECAGIRTIHGDLKGNYEALLKDLKEERDIHYTSGNSKWVERLDQKIRDLEKSIEDKFGDIETKSCSACGQKKESAPAFKCDNCGAPMSPTDQSHLENLPNGDQKWTCSKKEAATDVNVSRCPKCGGIGAANSKVGTEESFVCTQCKNRWSQYRKEAGSQNDSGGLVIMDHTPPRANSGPDTGGRDSFDEMQDEWAEPVIASTKLNVFKRELLATPLNEGYDISQGGKKLFHIRGKDSKPMNKKQLEFCAQIELERGYKKAVLKEDIAFLKAGSKVLILAQDKSGKRLKFANLGEGLRGWAPTSKFRVLASENETMKHLDHVDGVLGHRATEKLVDCPQGSGNIKWIALNELLPATQPPATPESLNPDLGAESAQVEKPSHKCPSCGKSTYFESAKGWRPFCSQECAGKGTATKESAKECPDCHGNFEGAEGATCPTCGRFAVQKEALRPALPPQILNRRQEVNASGCDQCDAAMINGVFCHETGCPNAPKKCRHGKMSDSCSVCSDPFEGAEVESSLEKDAIIVEQDGKFCVRSPKNKKWNGGCYPSRAAAEKRLQTVEMFKHMKSSKVRPFSKKADVLTDHITEVKNNIEQVQQRLQEVPAVKTALNIGTVTDETEEETQTGNSITPIPGVAPLPTMPTFNNVQPTDNDNLEIPTQMPTSPLPRGQRWVWDAANGAFVAMTDPTDPSKLV